MSTEFQSLKTIQLEKRIIDPFEYRKRLATEQDCTLQIDEPCIVFIGDCDSDGSNHRDEPAIVYLELGDDPDLDAALAAIQAVKFPTKNRTNGMISTSKTFGYQPRKIVHGKEACHSSAMTHEFPEASAWLCALAGCVARYYERYNPTAFARHLETVDKVLPLWKIGGGSNLHGGGSPFTSGIVNKNNQLPYHYDAGNFKGVWSNMLCFKDDIVGGNLSIPELDVTFVLKHNSLIMFDGQGLLHGVTPFRKKRPTGYRYTAVFYSLADMWMCLEPTAEIHEAAKRRRQRELKRSALGQTP